MIFIKSTVVNYVLLLKLNTCATKSIYSNFIESCDTVITPSSIYSLILFY